MTTYQQEPLTVELIAELLPMLEQHYEELTIRKDVVKLKPRWSVYLALQDLGAFTVYTVRDAGRLVGYSAFFVQNHMHYADLGMASNDVFYIAEDKRRGPAALRLIRFAETALKALGVSKVVYHYKRGNNFAPILHRLGYADEEGIAGKII